MVGIGLAVCIDQMVVEIRSVHCSTLGSVAEADSFYARDGKCKMGYLRLERVEKRLSDSHGNAAGGAFDATADRILIGCSRFDNRGPEARFTAAADALDPGRNPDGGQGLREHLAGDGPGGDQRQSHPAGKHSASANVVESFVFAVGGKISV